MSSLPFAQLPGLDMVYTRIGHGPFHFFSLLAVGFYYVTEGMLNVFTYVVAHAARKQWGLSSIETFFLVIARDIGAISTGLSIPWLGDRYGRLTVIKWGMLCRFTSLMISTMALSYHWLLCGLIMVGMSLGFNKPALSCIAIESLPIKSRNGRQTGKSSQISQLDLQVQ